MPTIAHDVIACRSSSSADIFCTDFYIKWSGFHSDNDAFQSVLESIKKYDVIAFNEVELHQIVIQRAKEGYNKAKAEVEVKADTEASNSSSVKLKHSIPSSISNRILWVDIFNGDIRCDVVALLHPYDPCAVENVSKVLFYDKSTSSFNLNPTSDVIASFLLHFGRNEMKAILRSNNSNSGHGRININGEQGQGQGQILLFDLWLYDVTQKIAVMDIDGTVTISDVRGYFETVYMGRYTYTHIGLKQFLITLKNKGYQIMYLTSRPLLHLEQTRSLIRNIRDEDNDKKKKNSLSASLSASVSASASASASACCGPMFVNRENLKDALYREIIAKTSAEFKASVLNDITQVFRKASCDDTVIPFALGVGNRITDMQAYLSATIPLTLFVNTSSKISIWSDSATAATAATKEDTRNRNSMETKTKTEAEAATVKSTSKNSSSSEKVLFTKYSDPALLKYLQDL
jgi:phosphatidate phosphatase PAH1